MSSNIRDLHSVVWNDPLAWLEPMKGKKWDELIRAEQHTYATLFREYVDHKEEHTIYNELTYALTVEQSQWIPIGKHIEIQYGGTLSVRWRWINEKANIHSAADLSVDSNGNVWDVADSGDGSEKYCIRFWKIKDKKSHWIIESVGPFVIVIGNSCYFLGVRNNLWYSTLYSVDAYNGQKRTLCYTETDPQWNLSLVRGENHTAYLVRENSGLQMAFFITEGIFRQILIQGFFVLGGGAPNDYLATEGRGTDIWKGYGPRLSRWNLPKAHGIPESVSPYFGLLVTRLHGQRFLWKCSPSKNPELLYKGIANIHIDTLGPHIQDTYNYISITEPGAYTSLWKILPKSFTLHSESSPYAEASLHFTQRNVPYVVVQKSKGGYAHLSKSLLVVGYGAYGISTTFNTTRWYPLLLRGWTIVFALVRGGGDDTQEWANAARTYNREISVTDFEDVIKDAQKTLGISSKETCIYGRSAGGILIGAAAARQTRTQLFSALYGEVPYLDVLRTTTNAALPLTQLEYDEFGNPRKRLEDLVAVARISPMEGIPSAGYPGLFALLRTGENDKEVLAYEPIKWILRARGGKKDGTKILAFESDEGHFVGGSTGLSHKISDLAMLLAWRRGETFRM